MSVEIVTVSLLNDNYAYLIHRRGTTVVVDPSEARSVILELEKREWKLDAVLNTHHHWDHVGGNAELKRKYQCPVWGPRGDALRIPALDREYHGGESIKVGALDFNVLFIPGHTLHHVALWLRAESAVFTGDTLFLMGCGRLFEGTAAQMWESLSLLSELPPETKIFCGHEYTLANCAFALDVTPEDPIVQLRMKEVQEKRRKGETTMPGSIAEEKATNPFLRLADTDFRNGLYGNATASAAFARLRDRKDHFVS